MPNSETPPAVPVTEAADPWRGRLAFGALVLVGAYVTVKLTVALTSLLLMVFGAVVVAVILRSLADPLVRRLKLPDGLAVFSSVMLVTAMIAAVIAVFGSQIAQQVEALSARLPQGWDEVRSNIKAQPYGAELLRQAQGLGSQVGQAFLFAQRFAAGVAGAIASLVLVIVAGVYLAIEPARSREGVLSMVPKDRRPRLREVMNACGRALKGWLRAQLVSMFLVGAVTGVGLAVIGVPAPLALGLLTGAAQFVPIVGPVAAAIPALLVAATGGWQTVTLTLALYVVVSQLEANIITPMVQKNVASLPVVLGVFAVIGIGSLFGPLGVLFATPLALVLLTVVTMLYRQDVLGDQEAKAPGQK
jgi:predicted PurR-regulated permease PerM